MEIIHLTPSGRGAVASFLFCGKEALGTFLPQWLGRVPSEQPTWGRMQLSDDGLCEEAVVHRTSEGIEMHVHGGEQVVAAIESLFKRHGAQSQTWQEHFTPCTSQRELALRLLPFAPTERTAQILLEQYNGAFDREMSAIEQLSDNEERRRRQERLQELVPVGKHLVEPFKVVLAGASNAGKSSLLNAILGFQRSLVHSMPGTTRDVVSGQSALDGFPVTFFDTAGFRETGDDLELQGIDRSLRSLADADLVVWVIDSQTMKAGATMKTGSAAQRSDRINSSNVILCYNKVDLLSAEYRLKNFAEYRLKNFAEYRLKGICVSALTGEGIETLLDAVIRRLIPHPPKPGEAVPIG